MIRSLGEEGNFNFTPAFFPMITEFSSGQFLLEAPSGNQSALRAFRFRGGNPSIFWGNICCADDDVEDLLLFQFLVLEPGLGGKFGDFAERFGADVALHVQVGAGGSCLQQPESGSISTRLSRQGDVQLPACMSHQLFEHGSPEHGIREQCDSLVSGYILDEAFEGISG